MRLADGILFPIPMPLPVVRTDGIEIGKVITLRSPKNDLIVIMRVEEMFEWDLSREACLVLGTEDVRHPLVAEMASWGRTYLSGSLKVVNLPQQYDFTDLRRTPAGVRASIRE